MMSRKRMLSGKRILAGILTAVMVVSSAQLPMSAVYAEEIAESVQEDENGSPKQESEEDLPGTDNLDAEDYGENEGADAGDSSQSDDFENEDTNKENPFDEETGKLPDGEDSSNTDAQEPSDEENAPAEDDAASEDGDDEIEESDTEELYDTGISDNDLVEAVEPELQEIMAEDELEGVYQFGGAPSERGNLSVYSESVYSVESSEAEKYLYRQMLERNTMIDISAYSIPYDSSGVTMLRSLVSGVLNEHPDLYFVERGYYYWNNGTIFTAIEFAYDDAYDDSAFKQSVVMALSRVNDQMSDLEKAVVLHDYLTINCEYDYQNYLNGTIPSESYNAYGTLVNRTAVCQGYALTYKYLLNQVGIDCYMVTSNSMNHAWNMIVLDGKNYQVDVTWDDPTWDMIGRSVHNYMFCSDAVFQDANHNHHDWSVTSGSEVVDYQATDTRYDNAFWTDCDSPLVLAGDDCYYVSSERSIKKTNLSDITNKGSTVVQSIGKWLVWGGGGAWNGSYSGLFQIGDRLYYNDNSSIYSIALDGTDKRTEFTADTSTGYIYGSAYCQGKVLYALRQSPNEDKKEEVLAADITVEGSDPVDVPVQRVELSAYTLELAEGEEAKLSATVYPTYATDSAVTWTSDDETVATVDNGKVRAVSVGSCTVTATAGGKKAECSVQVTAKGDNGGFGLNNLSYEYTTVDDAKISSAVNGRPKLLIFYSNTCGNCRNTIRGISSKIDKFAGIDVYALETNKGTKEEVIAFQQQYGCKEITFSYDKDGTNSSSMWAYAWACGIGNSISWPVICYIDANNRLQYITMSLIAADEVLSNLEKYCNAAAENPIQLGDDTDVIFKTNRFTYNGTEQEPKVVVRASDTVLTEGQDYTLSYSNNKNAGIATVTIDGKGRYLGSISRTFEIKPAHLVITAQDKTILIGDPIPAPNEYKYEVSGLMADDVLITEPAVLCEMIVSSAVAGRYDIVISGADAGDNYIISYVNGKLTVASEYVSCTVRFDVQGHGTAPDDQIDVIVGSTINKPADPAEAGYRFDGWYRDAACMKVWNFDSDIVQSDMTLYAKWLGGSADGEFAFQEIADVYYTGKACKPAVSVYDGDTLLRLGKDYQIKYYNNTNANKDGVLKKGNGEGVNFSQDLPYVEIIGKGNYTDRIKDGGKDAVKVNFNILRASIGDGTEEPAAGVTLKVSEQLVTAKKVQKPFTSIKYVKGMRKDIDFNVSLTVENARDQSGRSLQKDMKLEGAVVPAGYSGEFLLTVEGVGNYSGSICREIHVLDKAHLIKNAKITLGRNLKNITFAGKPVQLKPAETDSADTFSVKYGNTFLKPGRDYTVSYRNHDRVGKAELIITGMGEYAGSKTATFNIKGRSFTAKTVLVGDIEDKVYTGRAITQNGAKLIYATGDEKPQPLRYGTDYTISYSKNINKGTATMTFKGVANAGYSGSFKKTFKIKAADITQARRSEAVQNMVFSYCKAGVKPVNEILLTNQEGFTLRNGKDYTLKYVNNKAVAKASDDKPPTVIVKGKGNYAGEFSLNFEISRADLRADSIQIKTTPVAYKENKAEDYAYKPAVKLTDGKTALRAGKDYEIAYRNNTQADYERYIQKLQETAGGNLPKGDELTMEDDVPMAVITEAEGSSYSLQNPIIVPLPIYMIKLTKANLSVEIGEEVYTGSQVKPEMKVSYDGKLLRKGEDYTLSYGANTASGKNKGSVVINGIAPNYGGSVTVKFSITKKPITY